MPTLVRFIVSVLEHRFRSRAVLELENLALRHQLHVLRRQRPGRPRLIAIDRLLWVWLYRLWPRCLDSPDIRYHPIPRIGLANEADRRELKQSRTPSEQILSSMDVFVWAELVRQTWVEFRPSNPV